MRRSFLFALLTVAAAGLTFITNVPTAEAAPGDINAEILVIHATKCDKKTVDPGITEPPPSMGYECMALITKKVASLPLNQPNATPLPNGRTFQLIQTGVISEGGKSRYRLRANINSADGAGFTKLVDLTADPQKQFNVGGWTYNGGRLMVAFRIL